MTALALFLRPTRYFEDWPGHDQVPVGRWTIACPTCSSTWGTNETRGAGSISVPSSRPLIRLQEAEGTPVYGLRRRALRGHPLERGDRREAMYETMRQRTERIADPIFETWCSNCGARMRVDVAQRTELP